MSRTRSALSAWSSMIFFSWQVTVIRVENNIEASFVGRGGSEVVRTNSQKKPVPEVCAQVRHFLESSLEDVRVMWEKRMVFQACVSCWCSKECALHSRKSCSNESCQHFLLLDECLINKVRSISHLHARFIDHPIEILICHPSLLFQVVCCEFQRLKTTDVQNWFPEIAKPGIYSNSSF